MRVLLIEDENKVVRFLQRGLEEEHFSVDVAQDGEEGVFRALSAEYDVIILDVLLPKKNGFNVLAELRKSGCRSRVLMLTARDSVDDRVRGLDLGADDYLVKPFAFEELLARVRALLRRGSATEPVQLTWEDITLDLRSHKVTRGNDLIELTSKEFAVLEYLLRHPGEIVSRTRLAEHVWDEAFDSFSNVIDVTVYHLREKIDRGFDRKFIHTVRGVGYVLRTP